LEGWRASPYTRVKAAVELLAYRGQLVRAKAGTAHRYRRQTGVDQRTAHEGAALLSAAYDPRVVAVRASRLLGQPPAPPGSVRVGMRGGQLDQFGCERRGRVAGPQCVPRPVEVEVRRLDQTDDDPARPDGPVGFLAFGHADRGVEVGAASARPRQQA